MSLRYRSREEEDLEQRIWTRKENGCVWFGRVSRLVLLDGGHVQAQPCCCHVCIVLLWFARLAASGRSSPDPKVRLRSAARIFISPRR